MDDLISREAVENYVDNMPSELTEDGRRMIRAINVKEFIADCPSAFDGMTNGEVIQITYGVMVLTVKDSKVWVEKIYFPFDEVWWNAPYKAERGEE